MDELSPDRAAELISVVPWRQDEILRVFWIKVSGPRDSFVQGLTRSLDSEEIVALAVRDKCFTNSNELLSDMHRLFSQGEEVLRHVAEKRPQKLTIVVLVKDVIRLAQVSSPITLPEWFPVRPGLETYFYVMDLLGDPEGGLLNSPELKIDRIASLVYELEEALVAKLELFAVSKRQATTNLLKRLTGDPNVNLESRMTLYRAHLRSIADARAYRPNASATTTSLTTDLLRLVLKSTSQELGEHAANFGSTLRFPAHERLKPSYLGVSLRPKIALVEDAQANWHSILVGLYQGYQIMNAAAHAGDYGSYPVALLYHVSLDLQRFLSKAGTVVRAG